jgi:alpha-tubulin suppressor-like RCC1 family protein
LVSSTLTFNTLETSGWHTCGVASDGATYCWGANDYGQLGSIENMQLCTDVLREDYSCTGTPHPLDTPLKFVALAGSLGNGLTCGLTTEGDAYCWGFGLGGQLGDGQRTNSSTPVAVAGGLKFKTIRVGPDGMGACGTNASDDLYCWGPLGLVLATGDPYAAAFFPLKVEAAQGFISFDLGQLHACGVSATGQAYCWGNNWYGQLGVGSAGGNGDGGLSQTATPTAVVGGHVFRSIVTGSNQTCALTEAGEAYCWGVGHNIGSPTTSIYEGTPQPVAGGHSFLKLYAGFTQTCGVTAAGEAYCWGENYMGELGDGTQQTRTTPVKVLTDQKLVSLSHRPTCGLTAQGQAYCWGDNGSGQVGKPPYYENH